MYCSAFAIQCTLITSIFYIIYYFVCLCYTYGSRKIGSAVLTGCRGERESAPLGDKSRRVQFSLTRPPTGVAPLRVSPRYTYSRDAIFAAIAAAVHNERLLLQTARLRQHPPLLHSCTGHRLPIGTYSDDLAYTPWKVYDVASLLCEPRREQRGYGAPLTKTELRYRERKVANDIYTTFQFRMNEQKIRCCTISLDQPFLFSFSSPFLRISPILLFSRFYSRLTVRFVHLASMFMIQETKW